MSLDYFIPENIWREAELSYLLLLVFFFCPFKGMALIVISTYQYMTTILTISKLEIRFESKESKIWH